MNNFGFADLITNRASPSYVPPFWPPTNCINSVIVSTDQEKWRYRSLGFLISHRNAELPCFHSIFSKSELRLKFTDPAGVRALFRLLQRQFPGVEMLDIPNMFGANSLHCAVCSKLLLNLVVTDGILQPRQTKQTRCRTT